MNFTHWKNQLIDIAWSWLGGFMGIGAVAIAHITLLHDTDLVLMLSSFGSSAVLLYGAPQSPLAQPRNLLFGHLFSALVGVFMFQNFGHTPWLAASLAVATAIALMQITHTVHPPGGASALLAVIGGPQLHALGYSFVLVPTLSGATIMLVVALIINKLAGRSYPTSW